jgi:hypothetical protein
MVFWKSNLHRGPWVISKLTLSVIPPRYYSFESLTFHKTPQTSFLLPRGPSRFKQCPQERKGVARLTGGEIGPARGGVGSGRLWRSQRCMARWRGWPESLGPRAQAGVLVGGGCAGQIKAIWFNPMAR